MIGKNALVTGSTRGIGKATAEALAAEGCNVMLSGFGDAAEIEAERARIAETYGVTVAYNGADLGKEGDCDALTDAAVEALGPIEILVNNAVIRYFHNIDEFPREKWKHALAVNVTAPFILTQKVLTGMRERKWGRIINFSSVLGMAARAGRADYVVSKHAMLGLTRATAAEVRDTEGITCNAICPGFVQTPLVDGQIDDQAKVNNMSREEVIRDIVLASQPSKRFVEADHIAETVLFLCGPAAASFTGASLSIDGGWTSR